MLLSDDDSLQFLERLKKLFTKKIYCALKNTNKKNDEYLELSVTFFMDGVIHEVYKYFIEQSDYSLDELFTNIKKWFEKIFS